MLHNFLVLQQGLGTDLSFCFSYSFTLWSAGTAKLLLLLVVVVLLLGCLCVPTIIHLLRHIHADMLNLFVHICAIPGIIHSDLCIYARSPRGVEVKVLDGGIVVSEFELSFRHDNDIRTDTIWEDMISQLCINKLHNHFLQGLLRH